MANKSTGPAQAVVLDSNLVVPVRNTHANNTTHIRSIHISTEAIRNNSSLPQQSHSVVAAAPDLASDRPLPSSGRTHQPPPPHGERSASSEGPVRSNPGIGVPAQRRRLSHSSDRRRRHQITRSVVRCKYCCKVRYRQHSLNCACLLNCRRQYKKTKAVKSIFLQLNGKRNQIEIRMSTASPYVRKYSRNFNDCAFITMRADFVPKIVSK